MIDYTKIILDISMMLSLLSLSLLGSRNNLVCSCLLFIRFVIAMIFVVGYCCWSRRVGLHCLCCLRSMMSFSFYQYYLWNCSYLNFISLWLTIEKMLKLLLVISIYLTHLALVVQLAAFMLIVAAELLLLEFILGPRHFGIANWVNC